MAETVTNLLRRALALVETQQGAVHAAMVAKLDGLAFALTVEDTLVLRSAGGRLHEAPSAGRPELRLSAGRPAIAALVAGRTTLNEALRSGAIELAGTTAALASAMNGFEYFVCALLKIDAAEELRRELERVV